MDLAFAAKPVIISAKTDARNPFRVFHNQTPKNKKLEHTKNQKGQKKMEHRQICRICLHSKFPPLPLCKTFSKNPKPR